MTRTWSLRCRHRTKIRPSRSASAFCAPHRSAKWSPSKPGCTWSVQPHFTAAVARSSRVKIQQHANQKQPNKSWNSGISSQLLLAFATKILHSLHTYMYIHTQAYTLYIHTNRLAYRTKIFGQYLTWLMLVVFNNFTKN